MRFITDYQQAGYLLIASEICLDIETDTDDSKYAFGKGVGLSYVADITWVALWDGNREHPVLALQMLQEDHDQKAAFIKAVLSRPNVLLIGHNVGFDLRSLGGQYSFTVHLQSLVWDTQSIALLLMMSSSARSGFGLEVFERRLGLLSAEDMALSAEMKPLRLKLHEQPIEKVQRYVVIDVVGTFRLYLFQKKLIETTEDVHSQPVFDEQFKLVLVEGREWLASKRYAQLDALVLWELRIARWCANVGIRGVRLDKDYAEQHQAKLLIEYHQAVEQVVEAARGYFDDETWLQIQRGCDFEVALNAAKAGQGLKSVARCVFRQPTAWQNLKGQFKLNAASLWKMWCDLTWSKAEPLAEETTLEQLPMYLLHFDLETWLGESVTFPAKFERLPDLRFRIRILTAWARAYFAIAKEIDDDTLTNMNLFSPYFIFCVLGTPIPSNDELYAHSALVTDKVRGVIDKAEGVDEDEIEFRDLAHQASAWSMDKDALEYYEASAGDQHTAEYKAFFTAHKNKARITRSQEFLKHALRDGRIHPLIARRAQTGRAACSQPNLMNIPFVDKAQNNEPVFVGYLLPDGEADLLAGMDFSNAENYMAAFSFGDNAMAEACAGGDFHLEMTRIYWPELYAELQARIDGGDLGALKELKNLRAFSKRVTFGKAYGAGDKKISRQVGCTLEEAKAISEQRARRFAAIERGKKHRADLADKLYAAGIRPAYTTLWTGRRVFLDEVWREREVWNGGKKTTQRIQELKTYTVSNYLQQGGVGEVVWRSIVAIDEHYEALSSPTRVALQLHDEIILSVAAEQTFEVTEFASKLMADVIPELDRLLTTVPPTQFLAGFDGGNVFKWGWQANRPYPLDTRRYVNAWGVHTLRPDEKEAPTWIAGAHPDTTSVEELIRQQYSRLLTYRDRLLASGDDLRLQKVQLRLGQIRQRLGLFRAAPVNNNPFTELSFLLSAANPSLDCLQPKRVKIGATDYGRLDFSQRMCLFQQGYLSGKLGIDGFKAQVIDKIEALAADLPEPFAEQYLAWREIHYFGIDMPA